MKLSHYESKTEIIDKIKTLTARKEAIEETLTANSPASTFRELNLINYKIIVQESHLNGNYCSAAIMDEYHVKLNFEY